MSDEPEPEEYYTCRYKRRHLHSVANAFDVLKGKIENHLKIYSENNYREFDTILEMLEVITRKIRAEEDPTLNGDELRGMADNVDQRFNEYRYLYEGKMKDATDTEAGRQYEKDKRYPGI